MDYTVIFFDLEATYGKPSGDLTQISAETQHGQSVFNQYVMPRKEITDKVSEITKITLEDGILKHKGRPVTALSQETALTQFIAYLRRHGKCVLVAHSGHRFDAKILMARLREFRMEARFREVCVGFSDSFKIFKDVYPDQESYSQKNLCMDLCEHQYDAHNSLEDTRALKKLCNECVTYDEILTHTLSVTEVVDSLHVVIKPRRRQRKT